MRIGEADTPAPNGTADGAGTEGAVDGSHHSTEREVDPADDDDAGGGPANHPEPEEELGGYGEYETDDDCDQASTMPSGGRVPQPAGVYGDPAGRLGGGGPVQPEPPPPFDGHNGEVFIDDGDDTGDEAVGGQPVVKDDDDDVFVDDGDGDDEDVFIDDGVDDEEDDVMHPPEEVAPAGPALEAPGQFGRGWPTWWVASHDCLTAGCFRLTPGPFLPAACGVAELHCCVLCYQTHGGRHSRFCEEYSTSSSGPNGNQ